jgi:DNA mismatch repair protein PMS2
LKLSPATEETVVDHAEALQESGFRIEVNEAAPPGSRILVHSLPTLSGIGFNRSAALTVQDMLEIVARIEDEVFVQEEKGPILLTFLASVRSMFASKACRTAVMVGDILQVPRMHEIVQSLSNLENPWNCPHGRPTMKHLLSIQDLDRLV